MDWEGMVVIRWDRRSSSVGWDEIGFRRAAGLRPLYDLMPECMLHKCVNAAMCSYLCVLAMCLFLKLAAFLEANVCSSEPESIRGGLTCKNNVCQKDEVKCFLLYKKYIQLGFVFLIHSNYPLPMSQAFCIHLYLHKRTAFGWAFHPSSCDIIISKPTGKVWNTKDSIPEVEDLPMVLFFHCIDTVVGISINFFFMLHTIRLRLVISMESPTNKGLTWLNAFCCHLNVHSSCSKHGTTSYILLWPLWVTYLDLGQEFQFVLMMCYPAEY